MFRGEPWDQESRDWLELLARFERALADSVTAFFDDESLERIVEHYQETDDLKLALRAVEYALELNPYNAVFYLRKAEVLFELHRHDEAYGCTEAAAIYDPSELDIYFLRADIHVVREEYGRAVAVLEEALERADPEDRATVWVELAEVHEAREGYDQAYECLKKAIRLDPQNADALSKLWFVVDITERYEVSVTFHQRLIDEHPYSFRAWFNLGKAWFGMGLYEKAIEAYGFVHAIDERFVPVLRDFGEAHYRLGQYEEALAWLLQAADRGEPHEEVYFRIAQCREKLGELGGARHHYRKAIRVDPYHDAAYFRIGRTFLAEDQPGQALRQFRKAVQLDPDNATYRVEIARLLFRLEEPDTAIENLREALRIRPDLPEHWVQFCRMLFDSGERDAAVDAAAESLHHGGDPSVLRYLHAACLLATGRRREGTVRLEIALETDYDSHPILFDMFPELEGDPLVLDLIEQFRS